MKTVRTITTNDFVDNRLKISNRQVVIPKSRILSGSVAGKYPVTMADGKTIIFISDKSKESETRQRYEMQLANRFMKFVK
ncbi:MAG: hypothetical protein WCK34_15850 [Bacteroidota bacterium]